jgi:hypothetical protein
MKQLVAPMEALVTSIYLTEEQRQVVKAEQGRPIGVIDPATGKSYVLIGREQFEPVRGLIEDQTENSVPASEHDISVAPGIRRAQESYWRDLAELLTLKSPDRQWVAYHGSDRVAFGRTSAEHYQECVHRRGLKKDEIYIDRLEPRALPPWEAEEIEAPFAHAGASLEPPPHSTS